VPLHVLTIQHESTFLRVVVIVGNRGSRNTSLRGQVRTPNYLWLVSGLQDAYPRLGLLSTAFVQPFACIYSCAPSSDVTVLQLVQFCNMKTVWFAGRTFVNRLD
jgi:hypothetical protein